MIIGFSGRARHGKTESCEAIKLFAINAGKTAGIYDIGNIVRLQAINAGKLPQVERKDMTKDQLQVLIDFGKETRAVDENYWLDQMFNAIEFDNYDVALIPNLRYANEADAVRERNGYVVRVTRLNKNGSLYISPDRDANDISETSLEFWPADFYLTLKDGHVGLLRLQAVDIYSYLKMQYDRRFGTHAGLCCC